MAECSPQITFWCFHNASTGANQMQINKTDQNDAEGLAQIMRTGWYRAVHVKSFDSHRARSAGPDAWSAVRSTR
jgi:hypothetical protein